jgi:hypothetical protein
MQQSAGRNLGPRWDGESEHIAVVNEAVWNSFGNDPELRYAVEVQQTPTQRKHKKYNAKRRKAVVGEKIDFKTWLEQPVEPEQVHAEVERRPGPKLKFDGKPKAIPPDLPENSDDHPIELTMFEGLLPSKDPDRPKPVKHGYRESLSWVEWKTMLDETAQERYGDDKADAPAITAARFIGDRRLKAMIETSTMILLDLAR